jgi:cell division transport system permease protein
VKWRFFVAEAVRSVRGNVATTVAATVTVLIVTLLLGVTITIGKYVYDKTTELRGDVTVKLYFQLPEQKAKRQEVLNSIANQVRQLPYLAGMEYVSPKAALDRLSPKEREQIEILPFNPLPPAFYVRLTDPEKASVVAEQARQIPQVADCGQPPCVTYGKKIAERVLYITKIILGFVAGLMALLGVAAVVLIANTIRLSIFSRRREIEVMKLVGATNWFVRLPFVLEGMLTGLIGSLLAVVLLAGAYHGLLRLNSELADPVRSVGIGLLVLMLAGFGLLLGAFGSGLTLRRFLRV